MYRRVRVMQLNKYHGFTLVEIMVVIAIAALLAAVLLPVFAMYRKNIRYNTCVDNLKQLGVSLNMYYGEYGTYPEQSSRDYLFYSSPGNEGYVSLNQTADFMPYNSIPGDTTPEQNEGERAGMNEVSHFVWVRLQVIWDYAEYLVREENDWLSEDEEENVTKGLTEEDLRDQTEIKVEELLAFTVNEDPVDPYYYFEQNDIRLTSESLLDEGQTLDNKFYVYRKILIRDDNKDRLLKTNNYGLSTLYSLYLDDKKDYLRTYTYYHCPEFMETEVIDHGAMLKETTQPGNRNIDPLLNGYNSYDLTYNYNQFNNEIIAFNKLMGYGDIQDISRQLSMKNPPSDTVICWCFGHSPGQISNILPQNDMRAVDFDDIDDLKRMEHQNRNEISVVLWLDGSVEKMSPYIVLNKARDKAYFVPPYLYRRGGSSAS